MDQVTAVLDVLLTTAVNCCVCPPCKLAAEGVMVTETAGGEVTCRLKGASVRYPAP